MDKCMRGGTKIPEKHDFTEGEGGAFWRKCEGCGTGGRGGHFFHFSAWRNLWMAPYSKGIFLQFIEYAAPLWRTRAPNCYFWKGAPVIDRLTAGPVRPCMNPQTFKEAGKKHYIGKYALNYATCLNFNFCVNFVILCHPLFVLAV